MISAVAVVAVGFIFITSIVVVAATMNSSRISRLEEIEYERYRLLQRKSSDMV